VAAVAGFVLLIGALAAGAGVNTWLGRKAILRSHEVEAANGNLLRLLAAEAPRDRPLYVNLSADEEEIRYEIGLHLAMIHGRDDFSGGRSVRFLGDPTRGGERASLPAPGDWVIAPEGNYRYGMELPKAVWLAQWAKVFIVDAAGWRAFAREQEDAARLAVAFKELRCGWVVIVAGPEAPVLTPLPGM
jgi:hypothetical protein